MKEVKKKVHKKNELPLPAYFSFLTEVVKDEDKVQKIQIVESSLHQTTAHVPYVFYKPICRIPNDE